jgi:hypothetical protein
MCGLAIVVGEEERVYGFLPGDMSSGFSPFALSGNELTGRAGRDLLIEDMMVFL